MPQGSRYHIDGYTLGHEARRRRMTEPMRMDTLLDPRPAGEPRKERPDVARLERSVTKRG